MRESPIYQEILQEGIEKGRAEGKAETLQQVAIDLFNTGMALEEISRVTGLSVEQLQLLFIERGK